MSFSAYGQSPINPVKQVRWNLITGVLPPSSGCPYSVTGGITSTSATVTLSTAPDALGILQGETVIGTGIPSSTLVVYPNSFLNTVTISNPATATNASATLSFYPLGRPYTDTTNNIEYTCGSGGWFANSSGAGTVTSIGITVPARQSVSPSTITTSGTFAIGDNPVASGNVFAGPSSGSPSVPLFRNLVSADIPNNAASTSGNAATSTALAATPTQCSGGTPLATGVAANGNANCTAAPATGVTSFNSRTGAVVPATSDYTQTQIASGAIANGSTATTQTTGDNSTKVETTAGAKAEANAAVATVTPASIGACATAGCTMTGPILNLAAIDGVELVSGPHYMYYNPATYWKWQLQKYSSSQANSVTSGTNMSSPTDVAWICDSICGFGSNGYTFAASQYSPAISLGYVNFYSEPSIYGSFAAYTMTGCTPTRDDNTSAQNWGPAGSRLDCTGTWSLSYAPVTQFRFDRARVWYEQTPSGGSFKYTIDGGAPTTVSTAGTEQLGYIQVMPSLTSPYGTHTIALSQVSGNVRLYGVDTRQYVQPGVIIHFMQSGGSMLSQWVSFPAFTSQMLSIINPAIVDIKLGTNDAGAGVSASTFGSNLSSFITALSIPSTAALMVTTNTPRGTTTGTPQTSYCTDDAVSGALLEGYRTQIFSLATSMGFAVYDERRSWPGSTSTYTSYTTGCLAGMNLDLVHPSPTGTAYLSGNMAAAVFQLPENSSTNMQSIRDTPLLLASPAATIDAMKAQSTGNIIDSGTGIVFGTNNQTATDIASQGTAYWRFGPNVTSNIIAVHMFPTASNAYTLIGYQQGSKINQAYSWVVNSDASTTINGVAGDVIVQRAGTEVGRFTTAGITTNGNFTGGGSGLTNVPITVLSGGTLGSIPYSLTTSTSSAVTSPTTAGHTFFLGWLPSGSAIGPLALDANVFAPSIALATGTPTYAAGSGVTSVNCASFYTCTNTRGELTIVGGTATTGTIATLNFSATLSAAPGLCWVNQAGGATVFSVGHGTPTTAGFTITSGISVIGATVTVDYACQP